MEQLDLNMCIAVASAGLVAIYVYCLEQVLPNYHFDLPRACASYYKEIQSTVCPSFRMDCFPYGKSTRDPT